MSQSGATVVVVGDVGTQIRVTMLDNGEPLSLATATSLTMLLRKPSGECISRSASLYTDGSDGVMVYAVEDGLFDSPGTWIVQGLVTFPAGSWASAPGRFTALRRICAL